VALTWRHHVFFIGGVGYVVHEQAHSGAPRGGLYGESRGRNEKSRTDAIRSTVSGCREREWFRVMQDGEGVGARVGLPSSGVKFPSGACLVRRQTRWSGAQRRPAPAATPSAITDCKDQSDQALSAAQCGKRAESIGA